MTKELFVLQSIGENVLGVPLYVGKQMYWSEEGIGYILDKDILFSLLGMRMYLIKSPEREYMFTLLCLMSKMCSRWSFINVFEMLL